MPTDSVTDISIRNAPADLMMDEIIRIGKEGTFVTFAGSPEGTKRMLDAFKETLPYSYVTPIFKTWLPIRQANGTVVDYAEGTYFTMILGQGANGK